MQIWGMDKDTSPMIPVKAIVGFVAGFILAIGFPGKAVDLFGELGQCRFGLAPNGTFYESDPGMDYKLYMTPRCGSVGIADKFGESTFGWRLGYMRTGTIQARGNIARFGDDQNRQPCDPKTTIGCKAIFNGSGFTEGVTASLTDEHKWGLGFSTVGEAGLFFFRHRFHATATGTDVEGVWHADEKSSMKDAPSPFLGLMLKQGPIYFGMRHFFPMGHRSLSLTDHSITQYVLGVQKSL